MKKMTAFLLALLLLFALVGCGVQRTSAPAEPPPPAAKLEAPKAYSPTAPELTVCIAGFPAVTPMRGTYSWTEISGDSGVSVTADSVHPLDAQELLPGIVRSADEPCMADIQSDFMPDSFTVRRWSTEFWGDPENAVEEPMLLSTAPGDPDPDGNKYFGLQPGYVYEIHAVWNEVDEGSFGDAYYAFYVEEG